MTQIIEDGYGGNNDPQDNLTIQNEAIKRGNAYADKEEETVEMLRHDEGVSLHAIIKNAYQDGFLKGVAYRLSGGEDD